MYRDLTKLLDPFLVVFVLAALVLAWQWVRHPNTRRVLAPLALLLATLWAVSTPTAAFLAAASLEWHYPPEVSAPAEPAAAIVVLGGAIDATRDDRPVAELGEDTLYRCLEAVRVYQQLGPTPVLVSGGKVDPQRDGPTLARAMADFLAQHGIPREDLVLEGASRTTHENALRSAPLLRRLGARRIVLVTDAIHLARADLCFRAQGFEVVARGTRYRATDFPWKFEMFLPRGAAAELLQRVTHEWVGLAWYWWLGRFSPSPSAHGSFGPVRE